MDAQKKFTVTYNAASSRSIKYGPMIFKSLDLQLQPRQQKWWAQQLQEGQRVQEQGPPMLPMLQLLHLQM